MIETHRSPHLQRTQYVVAHALGLAITGDVDHALDRELAIARDADADGPDDASERHAPGAGGAA